MAKPKRRDNDGDVEMADAPVYSSNLTEDDLDSDDISDEEPSVGPNGERISPLFVEGESIDDWAENDDLVEPADFGVRYNPFTHDSEGNEVVRWTQAIQEWLNGPMKWPGNDSQQSIPGWRGKRPLGKGGEGITGLWVRENDQGIVEEEIVIKDIFSQDPGSNTREAKIMRRLQKSGSIYIPRLLKCRKGSRVRMYLEFCRHRDLGELWTRYRRWRQYFPEAFLWYVLLALCEAALVMKEGHPKATNWMEIVHRDIKMQNVLLGDEDPGHPHYPTPKLSDYGLAVKIRPKYEKDADGLRGTGTRGWLAPEQSHRFRTAKLPQILKKTGGRLSSWTNVWGIGMVVTRMMLLCKLDDVVCQERLRSDPGAMQYSEVFRKLLSSMINEEPERRPEVGWLCRGTRGVFDKVYRKMAMAMDQEKHNGEPSDAYPGKLYYRGSEINRMPLGSWIPAPDEDVALPFPRYPNPSEDPLNPPKVPGHPPDAYQGPPVRRAGRGHNMIASVDARRPKDGGRARTGARNQELPKRHQRRNLRIN
ncbi:MAG: hypothetical protein M1825_000489 [Sarcosagium campestre]|nr:MAG: hypothetical protein M1825_000489 [Sarcosagium campestre]